MLELSLLIVIAALLALAAAFATAQAFVMRRVLGTAVPWMPLFWITLAVGAAYTIGNVALIGTYGVLAMLVLAPLGVIVHALLVVRFLQNSEGGKVSLRDAFLGQAAHILFFAAQQIPFYLNVLRGLR
jgi:hypothetical protein